MKKILALLLAAAMMLALCACGTVTFTSTETNTTTDADGNTTTTTVTTTTENGETTTTTDTQSTFVTAAEAVEDGESHTADFLVVNSTGVTIMEMYVATPEADTWGDNCLEEPLYDGTDTEDRGFTLTYSQDSLLWEIKVVEEDGTTHEFDLDISECGAEYIYVEFVADDSGWGIYSK